MFPRMMNGRASIAVIALIAIAVVVYGAWRFSRGSKPELGSTAHASAEAGDTSHAPPREKDSVDLSDSPLAPVKGEPLEDRDFPVEKDAIGSIDFDEEMAVQVFPAFQGRILAVYG